MAMPTAEELTEMTEAEQEELFEIRIYMSKQDRQWRWTAVARNGKKLADSGEGYQRKRDLLEALDLLWPDEEPVTLPVKGETSPRRMRDEINGE